MPLSQVTEDTPTMYEFRLFYALTGHIQQRNAKVVIII